MCVCGSVCMCVGLRLGTHAAGVCASVCLCVSACLYTYTPTCVHMHVSVCVHASVCLRDHVLCVSTCVCVSICHWSGSGCHTFLPKKCHVRVSALRGWALAEGQTTGQHSGSKCHLSLNPSCAPHEPWAWGRPPGHPAKSWKPLLRHVMRGEAPGHQVGPVLVSAGPRDCSASTSANVGHGGPSCLLAADSPWLTHAQRPVPTW